ncbi:hypothetical protein [Novacetimonas pomaceti]|uniref:hypothetical protein n=1 Tax=Novacetimonas pomaceti TaxID=2021998 RepID=UPI001C2D1DE7|nr:hypothetical protein [Novacetimonas pomaceti]MBV1835084.1 hypothetical protein [Novacetimonas pomaceti]
MKKILLAMLMSSALTNVHAQTVVHPFPPNARLDASELNAMEQALVAVANGKSTNQILTMPNITNGSVSGTDLTGGVITPTGGSKVNIADVLASYATEAWSNSNLVAVTNGTSTGQTLNSAIVNAVSLSMSGTSLSLNDSRGSQVGLLNNTGDLTLYGWASSYRRIIPDSLKTASDGNDDAPSIQRALNILSTDGQLGGEIMFLPRVYNLNSPIKQTNQGVWRCVHGHMTTGGAWSDAAGRYGGTWFNIGSSFIGSSTSPITIYGGTAIGTVIDGCAFFEIQPASTNPPAGQASYSWAPSAYPFVIDMESVQGDVTITNTLWRGITKGMYSDFSGRLNIDHMKSDFYGVGIEIHHSYDVDRINDVQEWGFNGSPNDVMYYKAMNGILIRLFRADTPFIDKIFSINMFTALEFDTDAAGTSASGQAEAGGLATKVQIGNLTCDGSIHCIVNNAPGATFKADIIDFQGENNTASTPTAWGGSSPVELPAQTFGQIDKIYAQSVSESVVHMFGSGCSYVSVGNITLDEIGNPSGISKYIADGAPCSASSFSAANTAYLATPPARLMSSAPATYMPSTSTTKLYWPKPTAQQ